MKFFAAVTVSSLVSFSAFAQGFLGQAEALFNVLKKDTSPSYSYIVKGKISKKALAKGDINNAVIASIKKDLCAPNNFACPESIQMERISHSNEATVLKTAQGIFSYGNSNPRSSESFFDLTDLITDLAFDSGYVVFSGQEQNGFGGTQFVSILDKSNAQVLTLAFGYAE